MIIITISIAITIIIIISNTIYHYYYDHCYTIIVTTIIINKSSKLIHTRLFKPSQREVIQAYPHEVNHKQGIQADSHKVIQAYLHEARLIHTMLSNLIHMRLPTNKWSKLIHTRLFKLPKPLHKQAAQAYPHEIIRTKPDREKNGRTRMNKLPFQPWNFCPLHRKKWDKKFPDKITMARRKSKTKRERANREEKEEEKGKKMKRKKDDMNHRSGALYFSKRKKKK